MLLGLFFVRESVAEQEHYPIVADAIAGVLSFTALVLFRRTRPVALTLVLLPVGLFLGTPMGATPIALFSVALHRRARVAIALAVLHAALVSVVYGLALGLTRAYYESVVFLVLLHVSLVAVAMVVRSRRQLTASWVERVRQAEEGQRLRIEQARHAEREQIAREMHDVLAHRVSLLAVHAGALEVRRDAPAAEREAAGVIRQCAHDALEDLRTLLGMLRSPADDRPLPTLDDVPALLEQSRSTGAEVGLWMAAEEEVLEEVPDQTGRHAYRILQEALTNARKHSPGAPVRVKVDIAYLSGVTVRVDNPLATRATDTRTPAGRTMDSRWINGDPELSRQTVPSRAMVAQAIPGAGAGLAGLRERVELVGGRLEHGPTAAGEFNLEAWLPWHT